MEGTHAFCKLSWFWWMHLYTHTFIGNRYINIKSKHTTIHRSMAAPVYLYIHIWWYLLRSCITCTYSPTAVFSVLTIRWWPIHQKRIGTGEATQHTALTNDPSRQENSPLGCLHLPLVHWHICLGDIWKHISVYIYIYGCVGVGHSDLAIAVVSTHILIRGKVQCGLTYQGRLKMHFAVETALYSVKIHEFWLKFHENMYPRAQSTSQHFNNLGRSMYASQNWVNACRLVIIWSGTDLALNWCQTFTWIQADLLLIRTSLR